MEIRCPITDEVIVKISTNGYKQRSNYTEVWLNLADGSRARIPMSKNAAKNLQPSQVEELFAKIKEDRINSVLGKQLEPEIRDKQLERIDSVSVESVTSRLKNLTIEKNI